MTPANPNVPQPAPSQPKPLPQGGAPTAPPTPDPALGNQAVPSTGKKGKHTTVFVILDACRSDYVSPESMPFLHGLSQGAMTGQFESPPGFAQRTVMFSGHYPDTSGNFSAFVFDPDASPFAWVKKLGPLGSLVKPRKVLFPARIAINRITKWTTGAYHTDPAWIPPKFLPYFRPCEDMRPIFEPQALRHASIFDLCRRHGLKFRYLAHPVSGNDQEVHATLTRELRASTDYDLYVAQFSVPDQKGHVHGPHSDAMRKGFLRELDETMASVHAALVAGYESWDLFVLGDHGMAPVTKKVNVLKLIEESGAVPAKDYVLFVNSTLAVLWYLTEEGRRLVEAKLPTIPGTHVVTDEERRRLRIPTERVWGDRMLAAESGILFWPDYFHVTDSTILGMHGYLDKTDESQGMMCLVNSSGTIPVKDQGLRSLVDVFPTLCDLLRVPHPPEQEGESLLDAHPVLRPAVAHASATTRLVASEGPGGSTPEGTSLGGASPAAQEGQVAAPLATRPKRPKRPARGGPGVAGHPGTVGPIERDE